jgi:YidC/Oxa1 family membrane protein insertase
MSALFSAWQGLADADLGTLADQAAGVATTDAESGAAGGGGVFGVLVQGTETAITALHDVLAGMGLPGAYGVAIIMFTLFVKGLTFPLTYQQLSSTTKMQSLQPRVKEIQKRLSRDPEAANRAIAELYQAEEVNPLAGCIPTIVQIPVFISLYRALLALAKEDKINESFLWIPSLEGPTFGAAPQETLSWLTKWVDGAPALGWSDTLAYLTIPVILVITQYLSTQLMQPPKDPNKEGDSSQLILKVLPLMIGWFSLNVPAGLGIYWIVNNFVSTGASVFIRNQLQTAPATATPSRSSSSTGAIMDAEVVSSTTAPTKGFGAPVMDEEDEDAGDTEGVADGGMEGESSLPKKKSSSKKKKGRKGR